MDRDSLSAPEQGLVLTDISCFYADAKAKGAEFLPGPLDRKAELRCYLRDPGGRLIEIGQLTGLLDGILADKRPEDG